MKFSWSLHSNAAALYRLPKYCMKRFRARFHRCRVSETCSSKRISVFSRKRFCLKEVFGYALFSRQLVLTFTCWQLAFPQMGVVCSGLWTSGFTSGGLERLIFHLAQTRNMCVHTHKIVYTLVLSSTLFACRQLKAAY